MFNLFLFLDLHKKMNSGFVAIKCCINLKYICMKLSYALIILATSMMMTTVKMHVLSHYSMNKWCSVTRQPPKGPCLQSGPWHRRQGRSTSYGSYEEHGKQTEVQKFLLFFSTLKKIKKTS